MGDCNSWGEVSETIFTNSDDDEVLEECTKFLEESNSLVVEVHGGDNDWFIEEALPLGILFDVQEKEDERLKGILEDLNINFGENGKCLQKRKAFGEVNEFGDGVSFNEC